MTSRENLWTVRDDKAAGGTTCRYLISAVGVLSTPVRAASSRDRDVHGRVVRHRPLAEAARRLRRQARGGDRHRRDGDPGDPDHRGDRSTPHRVAAHAELRAARRGTARSPRSSARPSAATTTRSGARPASTSSASPWTPPGARSRTSTPRRAPADPRARLGDGRLPLHLSRASTTSSSTKSNEVASEFIRNKIRTIVKDPATAELLCPKNYPLTAKRPRSATTTTRLFPTARTWSSDDEQRSDHARSTRAA